MESVSVSPLLFSRFILTAVAGDLPPYNYGTESNNPTVCLHLPQYVIGFTELRTAQC